MGRAVLDFADEIRAYGEIVESKIAPGFARAVLELAIRKLVAITPVDSGILRVNWRVALDGAPSQIVADRDVLTRARRAMAGYKVGMPIVIVNDAFHASIVDDGGFIPPDPGPSKDPRLSRFGKVLVRGGYSTQAPRGMTEPTIEELHDLFYD